MAAVDKLLAVLQVQQAQIQSLEQRVSHLETRTAPEASSTIAPPNPTHNSLTPSATPISLAPTNPTHSIVTAAPPYRLRVEGLKAKWFTVSAHPTFKVSVLHIGSGLAASTVNNCSLRVGAFNGYDKHDDTILDADGVSFPVVDGVATVAGLKFNKVTSQHGGWFRLEFSVSGGQCETHTSPRIVIRCNRMKSDAKAETEEELHPDDDIARIPGMGKSYSKRWKELGFATVRDLSRVDLAASARTVRKALLEKLRKDRGSLTEDRLNKLLALADRVVDRHVPATERLVALSTTVSCDAEQVPKSAPSPILLPQPEPVDFLISPDILSVLKTSHSTTTTTTTTVADAGLGWTPTTPTVEGKPSGLAASAVASCSPPLDVDKMINFSACDQLLCFDNSISSLL